MLKAVGCESLGPEEQCGLGHSSAWVVVKTMSSPKENVRNEKHSGDTRV